MELRKHSQVRITPRKSAEERRRFAFGFAQGMQPAHRLKLGGDRHFIEQCFQRIGDDLGGRRQHGLAFELEQAQGVDHRCTARALALLELVEGIYVPVQVGIVDVNRFGRPQCSGPCLPNAPFP